MTRIALVLATLLAGLPQSVAVADDVAAEPAVGRLNYAGYRTRRHCTMAAISPHAIATASHCLEGVPLEDVHLLFGFDRMTWTHHTRAVAVHDRGGDLSIVCLAADDTAPATLEVATAAPKLGAPVIVTGYGRPRVQRPHDTACQVAGVVGAQMALDCAVERGGSGGPVRNEAGELIGIVSRSSQGNALAVAVPSDAAALCLPESG